MNIKHLCVDLSAHGLGHLAQTSAVLNSLCANLKQRAPIQSQLQAPSQAPQHPPSNLKLTIRSNHKTKNIRQRVHAFANYQQGVDCDNNTSSDEHQPGANGRHTSTTDPNLCLIPYEQDIGLSMIDAMTCDLESSGRWYLDNHLNYKQRVSEAAYKLEQLQPDVLFCNIPFVSIEAAALVGIPSVAMCSLNWADIFHGYFVEHETQFDRTVMTEAYEQMLNAYSKADVFLRPTPSMDMASLHNTQEIGPIISEGTRRDLRDIVFTATGCRFHKFVLIGLGGLKSNGIPEYLNQWPMIDGTAFIFPDSALAAFGSADAHDQDGLRNDPELKSPSSRRGARNEHRPDFIPQSVVERSIPYIDIVASVDCIMTKTGYGTQTEAVLHQVPTLCMERRDWPEHAALKRWHSAHGPVIFSEWKPAELFGCDRNDFDSLMQSGTAHGCNLSAHFEELLGADSKDWAKYPPIQSTGAQEAVSILERMLFPPN